MSTFSAAIARAAASLLLKFGESVSYQTAGGVGAPVALSVVWSDDESLMPEKVRATAWFLAADLPGVRIGKGDTIRRGDFLYQLFDPPGGIATQRDRAGGVTVFLRQISHADA